MNKREFDFLEKCFVAELEGRLYQSKSKLAKYLESIDAVVLVRRKVGRDALGDIIVTGYTLTYFGNWSYCQSCDKE